MKQIFCKFKIPQFFAVAVFALVGFTFSARTAAAATYSVTNTNDSGSGSFRQAVTNADANSGPDQIDFAIPGSGPHTITMTSGPIHIHDQVKVNGLSQAGSTCNGSSTQLNVRLDINGIDNGFYFAPGAEGSELNGMAVANASYGKYALFIEAPNTTVRCNFFATYDGQTVASTQESSDYVLVYAPGVTIGGDSQTDMNLSLATSYKFDIAGDATSVNVRNNILGVTLDGTTAVAGSRGVIIGGVGPAGEIKIRDNLIYSTDSSILVTRQSTNTTVSGNTIGLNRSGTTAFAGSGIAVAIASGSGVTIQNNHMATTVGRGAIDFPSNSVDDVIISDNKINVTADGATAIAGTGDGNRAITTSMTADGSYYDNWQITGNQMYANALAMMLYNFNNLSVTNNIVNMNTGKTNCFDNSARSVIMLSQNVMVGGTNSADANTICGLLYGALENNSSSGDYSVLGNTLISNEYPVYSGGSSYKPTIIATYSGDTTTDVVFRINAPAGNYRVEFFTNDSLLNAGNYPNAKTFAGYTDITSSGSGAEVFTKTIPGTNLDNLSSTATIKNGSSDGYGNTSSVGRTELEADVAVSTTDDTNEVSAGTQGHEITQTFTNTGPSSVTDISTFLAAQDCFVINSVNTAGTATDPGVYTDGSWHGLLEAGQTLSLIFVGDVSCSPPNALNFANPVNWMSHGGANYVTNTSDSVDTGDSTAIVNPPADLAFSTTDGLDMISESAPSYATTQTIQNNSNFTITDIDFTVYAGCFDVNEVVTSGTATNLGTYSWTNNNKVWSGTVDPGQTLILTFNGTLSCGQGNTLEFNHVPTSIKSNSLELMDSTSDNNDHYDSTLITGNMTDLSTETTDGLDSLLSTNANYNITQTITNNGPFSVTAISFEVQRRDCITINTVSTSGTATDAGEYDSDNNTWSGVLEPSQSLVLTFAASLTCQGGSTAVFEQRPASITNNDGPLTDSTGGDDYTDSTDIADPVSDTKIEQSLANPRDIAPGAVLDYDIAYTNLGPQTLDTSAYTGSTPGLDQLFIYLLSPDVTYVGVTSNDNITCTSFGPGSAALFGPSLANHSDYEVVLCGDSTGSEHLLTPDQSWRATIHTQVANDSDLNFTNYIFGAFGTNDPSLQTMAGLGSNDLIDYLQDHPINNFTASAPMIDVSLEKTLIGNGSMTPGDIVTYNIAVHNKGPMSVNLGLLRDAQVPIFVDLYPADSLQYRGVDSNYACQDLGPGSIAFLGNAGINHQNHQLLPCAYAGPDQQFNPGDTINVHLSFEVVNGAKQTATNYAVSASVPTDPDVYDFLEAVSSDTQDILDTITNENFSKVTYTASPANNTDSDGDGIADSIEDSGPHGGDANSDGTPDSQQPNVTSFVSSISSKYVALAVSDQCSIASRSLTGENVNTAQDKTFTYPLGLMGFQLNCEDPGYTATITQYYFNETNRGYEARKYNPNTNSYSTIDSASIAQQTVDGLPVVVATYQVKDGGSLDTDGAANGTITDPAGLAIKSSTGLLSGTGENNLMLAVAGVSTVLISIVVLKITLRKKRVQSAF